MRKRPLLQSSGQFKKLAIGCIVMVGCAFAFWHAIQMNRGDAALAALAFSLVTMVATAVSVRCPQCGARWLWMAVSKKDIQHWGNWLFYDEVPSLWIGIWTHETRGHVEALTPLGPSQ